LNLKEINKEKTPELFYSAQDVENNWIETDTLAITGGIQLRKRCLNGWQDLLLRSGALQLYFVPETIQTTVIDAETSIEETVPDESNAVLVADGILIPQKKVDGTWENMQFTSVTSAFTEGDTDAQSVFSNGIDTATIDFKWRIGDSKQTYTLESTLGSNVRIAAIVNDYKEPDTEVKQSFADYLGLTAVETLTEQDDLLSTRYVFESEGKVLTVDEPVFIVDPYLELTEETDNYYVYCDGYYIRLQRSFSSSEWIEFYDNDDNLICWSDIQIALSGANYTDVSADPSTEVITDYKTFVKLIITGIPRVGSTDLTNCTAFKTTYIFYPDRFTKTVEFTLSSSIDLVSSSANNRILTIGGSGFSGTLHGTDSAESAASSYDETPTGINYVVMINSAMNIMIIPMHDTVTPNLLTEKCDSSRVALSWNGHDTDDFNTTISAGTHVLSGIFIIDSAEREAGDKLYGTDAAGQTGRLQQGIQYTNLDLLDITTGAAVTGGIDDDTGFHADGAYHIGVEYE
jgi:hypothetical protein